MELSKDHQSRFILLQAPVTSGQLFTAEGQGQNSLPAKQQGGLAL